jgi:hypothetical protein
MPSVGTIAEHHHEADTSYADQGNQQSDCEAHKRGNPFTGSRYEVVH